MAEKIDRKQLKRPDEFQVVAGKAMEWLVARQRQVVTGAVAVAAVALLAWGFSAWRSSRDAKAGAQLSEALELASRPIMGEGPPPQAGQETFASKDERDKAVMEALEKVRAGNPGTIAAMTALAEVGFHKLAAGDAAGAQKDLETFLAAAAKDHPLRAFAQESLGYAVEAQKKLDEARAAFEKLRDLGFPARADYQAARLALVEGKPDAKAQLEKVAKDYPKEAEVVREANVRLELASLPPLGPTVAPAPQQTPADKPAPKPAAQKQAKKPPAKKK